MTALARHLESYSAKFPQVEHWTIPGERRWHVNIRIRAARKNTSCGLTDTPKRCQFCSGECWCAVCRKKRNALVDWSSARTQRRPEKPWLRQYRRRLVLVIRGSAPPRIRNVLWILLHFPEFTRKLFESRAVWRRIGALPGWRLNFRIRSRMAVDGTHANIKSWYYPRSSLKKLWRQYFGYGFGKFEYSRNIPVKCNCAILFLQRLSPDCWRWRLPDSAF